MPAIGARGELLLDLLLVSSLGRQKKRMVGRLVAMIDIVSVQPPGRSIDRA